MSIIDRQKLDDLYKGFKGVFNGALERAQGNLDAIAMHVDSEGAEEEYTWLGSVPKMRQWIGDRQFDRLRAYSQTIPNLDWEGSIEVKANDIRDDRLNNARQRITELGEEAGYLQYDLVVDKLIAGFTTLCYDGQYFFDTDHDGPSGSQSNKGTSALDSTSYQAAWEAMTKLVDDTGHVIRVQPTTLIVGPKLRATGMALVEAETLSSGASNTNFGSTKLIVEPKLIGTYDDYWFLIAGGGAMRPIVLQEREQVEFIAKEEDGESYFHRKTYQYGASWRGNAGYALWHFAYGAVL